MIALRLIENASAAGCSIEVEDGDLVVESDRDPPAELIASLRRHKAELIAALLPRDIDPDPHGEPPSVLCVDLEERAALVEFETGGSRSWAEGFAALSTMPAPTGFSARRWQRIIDATGAFLDRWANEAARLGWNDLDIFSVNPDRPDARFDCMGLVLLLDRAEVIALDHEGATLRTQTGSELRYRRRPLPAGTVSLWNL
jgi:hypothetical protein